MNSEDFVLKIHKSIIEENLKLYVDMFETTDLDKVTDQYGEEVLKFYNTLNIKDKDTLKSIIRQTMIDTISNIFGILDGSSCLDGESIDFKLEIDNKTPYKINGDLQDHFLELQEK